RQRDFSAFLQVVSLSCLGVQTRASFLRRVDRVRLEGWLKRNHRELSSERDTSVFQAALSCRTLSTGAQGMRRRILPKRRKRAGFYQFFVLSIITVTITLCVSSPARDSASQSGGVIGTGPKAARAVRVEHAPR